MTRRAAQAGLCVNGPLKPGTHRRQSRQSPKPATNRRQRLAGLSPIYRKLTVASSFDFDDRVAVDIVAKVEHVQLGRLLSATLSKVVDFCRPNVERPFDFVACVYWP